MLQIISDLQNILNAKVESTESKWFTGNAHLPLTIYKLDFEVLDQIGHILCEERCTDFPVPDSRKNLNNLGFIFLWTIKLARNTDLPDGSLSIRRNSWIAQLLGNGPIKVKSTIHFLNTRKFEDFQLDPMITWVNIDTNQGSLSTQTHLSNEFENPDTIIQLIENLTALSVQIQK